MATEEPYPLSGTEATLQYELAALLTEARGILSELQALQQEYGGYVEQLAAVDWSALAQQGKLAGIPKFLIERTIIDARNVLTNGLHDLANIIQEVPAPSDEFVERVRALVRLYTDTPSDLRHRYQRLTGWMARINQAMQQHGEPPLTTRPGMAGSAASG